MWPQMLRPWLAALLVLVLGGCGLEPFPLPPPSASAASTPIAAPPRPTTTAPIVGATTATAPVAATTTTTATSTAAPSVSATPTITPTASTPPSSLLPPSPVVRANNTDGYCQQPFGAQSNARFSARLEAVDVRDAGDRLEVVLQFRNLHGDLHGVAACQWANAWPQNTDLGSPVAPDAAFIALRFDDWAHDDAWSTSIFTDTRALVNQGTSTPDPQSPPPTLAFAANSLDSRGTLVALGLPEPRPFAVRVEGDRLIVAIADEDTAPFPPADDPLGEAHGTVPQQPVVTLDDGVVLRTDANGTQSLSTTLSVITSVAIDAQGAQLALCAAADPNELDGQALWLVDADGSNERLVADVGGCAEPTFSPDRNMLAFVAPGDTGNAALPTVWTVPTGSGDAAPVLAGFDQWRRSSPRWLSDDQLVYRAASDNGASVLMLNANGVERELSARLLTGTTYRSVGTFVVDPEGDLIAVEALHTTDEGADLVLLRADGSVLATEQRGFRQRPLGFAGDGLVYLTIECASDTVQRYALRRRSPGGTTETLLAGSTAHSIDVAATSGNVLVYVRSFVGHDAATNASSEVWLLAGDGAARVRLHHSQTPVTHAVPVPAAP